MTRLSILLLVLLGVTLAEVADAQTLPFRSYSIEQGFSESVAHDMLQDHKGYYWIATGYGLNRFDGVRVKTYYTHHGLNDNQINVLYEDRSGRLWVGTDVGVSVMENDTLITPSRLDSLNRYVVDALWEDSRGDLWIGTRGGGVWLYNGGNQLVQYTINHGLGGNQVRDISEDSDGKLWFATDGGLTGMEAANFETYDTSHGLPGNDLHDIEFDETGKLWIGTGNGLSVKDGNGFFNYDRSDGLINNVVLSVSPAVDGRVWLGTENGASLFENGTFTNYTTESGLASNIVYSTMIDRQGHVWIGTLGGGANIFLGDYFHNFTVDEGLSSNVVTTFTEDQHGHFWIGSYGGGVMRYDGEDFEWFFEGGGLADNKVYTLYRDEDDIIWVGTRNGISLFIDGEIHGPPEIFSELTMVRRFFRDPDNGDFWIATYNEGVFRYDGSTLHQYSEDNVLQNNTVMSIKKDDDGRIWFGTYGGVTILEEGEFITYTTENGLPSNGVIKVYIDHNNEAWFATFNGFARFNDGEIETFESSFGLSGTISYFIFQDHQNYIWIGTNIGIIRFDLERYRQAGSQFERDLSFRLVSREQGLIANEMNAGAIFKDQSGSIWLGSVEGVSRFFPDRLPEYQTPPMVHFEEVMVAGDVIENNAGRSFSHDRNFVQFEFLGISMDAPNRLLFEYRMRGVDEEWNRTYDRTIRYPSLSPGEYEFQLRAYNSSGVRSAETARFGFEIRQPFWLQWWFLSLFGLVIAGIVVFIYNYYRVRRMIEIERMRVQIASDLHDDVGSSLTELALQTDFLRTGELEETVEQTLKQIGEHSRRIVSTLDDIVWSIDARNDTVGDLTDRMQDHVNKMLTSKGIEVYYHFSDLDTDERLSVQVKENLYLIFKEAINNIAKHSNADEVHITMEMSQKDFVLDIKDNGTIKTNGRKSGQGLRNMNMRAKRINANAIIHQNEGFSVTVEGSFN